MIAYFDFILLGISISGIGIIGSAVFFDKPKSATNRLFLTFCFLTILWSVANYVWSHSAFYGLWVLRVSIFIAVWHVFSLLRFLTNFPNEVYIWIKWHKLVLLPLTIITSLIALTPLVFTRVLEYDDAGIVLLVHNGPGIILFTFTIAILLFTGLFNFGRQIYYARDELKQQYIVILVGIIITFALILIFNFIFPAFFGNRRFTPLAGAFIFPFVLCTAYAMARYSFLNLRILTTEFFTFIISVFTLFQAVTSSRNSPWEVLLNSLVFSLVLFFGILLIRSVRNEITQRERLEKLSIELQAANERLKDLDRIRSEFLSFASHQVKAPMAIVKGYAGLISDGSYGEINPKVKEVSKKIKESADRLIALVNNLLDLRRLEEGRMDYKFEDQNISIMISQVIEELKPLSLEKGLALNYESGAKSIMVKVDTEKFRQVVQNLIDNSIKYTESGFVKVECIEKKESATLIIKISDSGLGISHELLPHLFSEFTRDPSIRKTIHGTGLGLYIAKQIVEAHLFISRFQQ